MAKNGHCLLIDNRLPHSLVVVDRVCKKQTYICGFGYVKILATSASIKIKN